MLSQLSSAGHEISLAAKKIFEFLLPLQNAFAFWMVIFILLLFACCSTYLHFKAKSICSHVDRALRTTGRETVEKEKLLTHQWERYAQTFLAQKEKTYELAQNYFNEQSILSGTLNLRFWYSLPGLFVGLGILGTFIGLTYGVREFNTESIASIQESIKVLLAGMGTAFITSVWGMGLSLLFGVLEKHYFKNINRKIALLCLALDRQYKMTKADEQELMKEEQEGFIRKFFVHQVEEKDVLPSVVFRDLRHNTAEQTKALKSFSTDLADGIQISAQTIAAFGKEVGEVVQMSFSQTLAPALAHLNTAIGELRKEKEESSGRLLEHFIMNVKEVLTDMGQQINQSFSGEVTKNLDKLAQIVGDAGGVLSDLPEKLQVSTEAMKTEVDQTRQTLDSCTGAVQATMEQIVADMKSQFEGQRQEFANASRNMSTAAEELMNRLRNEIEGSSEKLGSSMLLLTEHIDSLLKRQEESAEKTLDQLMNKMTNSFHDQREIVDQITQRVNESAEQSMQMFGAELENAAKNLNSQILSLTQNIRSMLDRQGESAKVVSDLIVQAGEVLQGGTKVLESTNRNLAAMNEATRSFQGIGNLMDSSSKVLGESSLELKSATETHLLESQKLSNSYERIFEGFSTVLHQTQNMTSTCGEQFEGIKGGLSEIFSQIEQGLLRYQQTTRESLNNYLSQFVDNLDRATRSLHGILEGLNEVAEEIAEAREMQTH